MGPFVVLTRDSIDYVMDKTGKSREELIKILDDYEKENIYKVKIPLPTHTHFRYPSL